MIAAMVFFFLWKVEKANVTAGKALLLAERVAKRDWESKSNEFQARFQQEVRNRNDDARQHKAESQSLLAEINARDKDMESLSKELEAVVLADPDLLSRMRKRFTRMRVVPEVSPPATGDRGGGKGVPG